jgi:hypothetical protein
VVDKKEFMKASIFISKDMLQLLSDFLDGGDMEEDDDNNSDVLHHLLTGRGPVMDELSVCSVPAGSLLSSTQDLAVAGSSCITPSLRLGKPPAPATVTSGAYLEDTVMQTNSTGSVQGRGLVI